MNGTIDRGWYGTERLARQTEDATEETADIAREGANETEAAGTTVVDTVSNTAAIVGQGIVDAANNAGNAIKNALGL